MSKYFRTRDYSSQFPLEGRKLRLNYALLAQQTLCIGFANFSYSLDV